MGLVKKRGWCFEGGDTPMHKCYRRKKNNVDKDKLNEPGDGLQINQNGI